MLVPKTNTRLGSWWSEREATQPALPSEEDYPIKGIKWTKTDYLIIGGLILYFLFKKK